MSAPNIYLNRYSAKTKQLGSACSYARNRMTKVGVNYIVSLATIRNFKVVRYGYREFHRTAVVPQLHHHV